MESWRMREYIKGMSITIFILTALNLVFLPLVLELQNDTINYDVLRRIMYGVDFPTLFVSIGMFFFSFALWKTIVNKNMIGMKTLIKIGCYIIGGFELLVCAAGVISPLVYMGFVRHGQGLFMIPVCIFTVFTIFVSLMIHGVRKFKPRLVNIYIIFMIVIFALLCLCTLVLTVLMGNMDGVLIMIMVNTFLLGSLFYFYYNGFFVLHYNIMIGKGEGEEGSVNLAHNRPVAPTQRI